PRPRRRPRRGLAAWAARWPKRWRRWRKRLRQARRRLAVVPLWLRLGAAATVGLILFAVANIAYHVAKKPTELLFPLTGAFVKNPAETWKSYGPLFREYATSLVSAELLAALAQAEGSGDPIARTYWRWR